MPDSEVATIQDLIYYQYAKIIARRAFSSSDGVQAKQANYGFIKITFRELKGGRKTWSEITREDWQLVLSDPKCAYCGSTENLNKEHIVPKSLSINPRCEMCPHIQEVHNQIWACKNCNSSKGTLGLYEFFQKKHPGDKKFYDRIPPLLEKKYLKTIYNCHQCANTLTRGDLNGDGKITVLDLDWILHNK